MISLLVLPVLLVNLTPVQNFIARKATEMLARKLKTTVSVRHVRIDFLNHVSLQGLYIEGHAHDTLLYAGEAEGRITDWFFMKKEKPVVSYIGLHNANVHLYRTASSNEWNYQFIIDAFATKEKKKTQKKQEFELDLKKVELDDVHFHMDDAWAGSDMDFDIGALAINVNNLDLKKNIMDVANIKIAATSIIMKDYKGGKPADTARHKNKLAVIDNTPFNPDKWVVHIGKLDLKDCIFNNTMSNAPAPPTEFDPDHLYVRDINIIASSINIKGDTLHGNLEHLTAKERCGIMIKEFRSKVTVSPNASICDNLYLETNNSKLQHYYAMYYKRFPYFTNYIDSVVMEAHLKDAVVDSRDVAYFSNTLRQYPAIIHISGDAKGTVADLHAKGLNITDGSTVIKGDVSMAGLPDIYKTRIDYTNGEFLTTGAGILRYAPSLKNNPDIALDKITYGYFKGSYTGYIENFAVNGILTTNLGSITSNVHLDIPGFESNRAGYSGTITTSNLNIGTFLRQPDLGTITVKADVNGNAFDPEHAQIKLDAFISQVYYNGYDYHNITAQGTLARKQFTGMMQVNDSNLSMAFNGNLDFSQKEAVVNAKANLLRSDFRALHLTKDTITASGDFDLNCTGNSIDNFSGYAKLYNIDVKRNKQKLSVDSITVYSAGDTLQRSLVIRSNDIQATIKGSYQLTKLPASIQYYLAGYVPNYLKKPDKYAPDQNLTFNIYTYKLSNLLSIAVPAMKGFDSSVISGSLNTSEQKLSLIADVPYGKIGKFRLNNILLTGDGDFNKLNLNTQVDNVALSDSFLNGSLNVTATLGNDSLHFNIATTAQDINSSVTLNGDAYARSDSIYLFLKPSQFYLNQTQWNVLDGSTIAYSDNYLLINNLVLQSGLQKITTNTSFDARDESLSVVTENLDLGQLGNWAGMAVYQPDGRVNGTIQISHLFKDLVATASLKAIDVKLGTDTLGNINITGTYDAGKKLISLDPQTGIYRGNASITASGDMSFDSTAHQKLSGNIQFNNAPASWSSSFLLGLMSHVSGTLNGEVSIGGTSYSPNIKGTVSLRDAGMHIDFLGTDYTIPAADISIDNHTIDVGEVTLYDRFKNTATLTGNFSHNLFKNMEMRLAISSQKFEVFNLHDYENQLFYGNLVAGVDPLTIRGPFDDIAIRINHAVPMEKSQISLPVSTSSGTGTYNYVSFKTYGKDQGKAANRQSKISIDIDAQLNDLAEMRLVLDPTTGDAITAKGTGSIRLEIPANNDIRMFGTYNIDEGRYTFSFKQLFLHREFILNEGSNIQFNGLIGQTSMNVDAVYTVKTRLYDLLSDAEKLPGFMTSSDLSDAQTPQNIDVLLHMKGSLKEPKLTFNIDLPDRRSIGTYAYTKLQRLNQDDRQLFDQVASILLIGDFIPPEGVGGSTAGIGALNNVSQIFSSTASSQITNLVNKITGNKDVAVDLKYNNYNLSDPASNGINRSQLSVGVRKNYFHDRLVVEVGGVSDWGKPANTSTSSSFNIAGDFRVQLLLNKAGGLRLNGFRTSDYDVTLDRDITRGGVGLSWRKTFDNLDDFVRGNKYAKKEAPKPVAPAKDSTIKSTTMIIK